VFIKLCQFQVKSRPTDTFDHLTVFWWTFKIRQCLGPYCEHEV